jgi:hypothetical protein
LSIFRLKPAQYLRTYVVITSAGESFDQEPGVQFLFSFKTIKSKTLKQRWILKRSEHCSLFWNSVHAVDINDANSVQSGAFRDDKFGSVPVSYSGLRTAMV